MGKFALIQAVYAVTGILFFVRDLMVTKLPMGKAMINAFIWPYAQFQLMKTQIMAWVDLGMSVVK
ncbi:MAG: hypothetical protein AB7E79_09765 [Rhodospirillaceae bacterium]